MIQDGSICKMITHLHLRRIMERLIKILGKSTTHSVCLGKAVAVDGVITTEFMKMHHLFKRLRSASKKIMDR